MAHNIRPLLLFLKMNMPDWNLRLYIHEEYTALNGLLNTSCFGCTNPQTDASGLSLAYIDAASTQTQSKNGTHIGPFNRVYHSPSRLPAKSAHYFARIIAIHNLHSYNFTCRRDKAGAGTDCGVKWFPSGFACRQGPAPDDVRYVSCCRVNATCSFLNTLPPHSRNHATATCTLSRKLAARHTRQARKGYICKAKEASSHRIRRCQHTRAMQLYWACTSPSWTSMTTTAFSSRSSAQKLRRKWRAEGAVL